MQDLKAWNQSGSLRNINNGGKNSTIERVKHGHEMALVSRIEEKMR